MHTTGFPSCCGAQVLYSFPAGSGRFDFNNLVNNVQKAGSMDGGRQMRLVILSDDQCRNEATLKGLAELGFVYVARSNNGVHDSWINLFVRSETRGQLPENYVPPPFSYPGVSTLPASPVLVPKLIAKPADPKKVPDPFAPPPQMIYVRPE